jgi:ABC-type nitrate/sulfonate/bicarbonate transport system substrate-binding protein
MRSPTRRALVASVLAALVLAACGNEGGSSSTGIDAATTAAPAPTGDTSGTGIDAVTTAPAPTGGPPTSISPERCQQNKDAGKITYLSGFDFAAAAGIVDVVVADAKGYFDELCLDVELKSSFSTANYPIVAAGDAQFASAGSFSETLQFAQEGGQPFVVVQQDGHEGIDALLVKDGQGVASPADLKGKTIGVKGAITPSVKALLFQAGLVEGTDYQTVLLDGFDPQVHIQQPVAGFPVYKSNEPGQLERAGIPFTLFDPAESDIPGSFGVIYTNAGFASKHPTAVQDFVRASLRGLADAIADPDAAIAVSLAKIKEGGNKNFLSDEGESFRWKTEAKLVQASTAAGSPLGVIVPAQLQQEVDAYAKAGVFAKPPAVDGTYDATVAKNLYDERGNLIWPG